MVRGLRRWLVALAVVVLCPLVPVASATPSSQAQALESYRDLLSATEVPAGWTGQVEGCVVGTESAASLDATLTAVNTLRDFAGLTPVALDPALNRPALAAALMMRAAGSLSHSPGPGWPCFSPEGAEGAGSSNLALGTSGAGAMIAYIEDTDVASLGHRRWLLDPRAEVFGTGSTGTTNALYVTGPSSPAPDPLVPEVVAWPPAGHVPWPLIVGVPVPGFGDPAAPEWSVALTSPGGGAVDLSAASVRVNVNGRGVAVSNVTGLDEGFGTGSTLSWRVGLDAVDWTADATILVTVEGVLVDGVPRTSTYSILAFPTDPPGLSVPDRDSDGVPDADDDCPAEPGPASGAGCPAPDPGAREPARFTLSAGQLLINQRISQAAIRRLNAVQAWLDAGIVEGDLSAYGLGTRELGEGIQTGAGPVVPSRPATPRPIDPAPARRGDTQGIEVSVGQLLINQRISQAAVRRANALEERLQGGLTGGDVRDGAIGAPVLARGLAILSTSPAPAVAPSRTLIAPAGERSPGAVTLGVTQLIINQRISQAAVRRANALIDALGSGLSGANFRAGSLTAVDLAAPLR